MRSQAPSVQRSRRTLVRIPDEPGVESSCVGRRTPMLRTTVLDRACCHLCEQLQSRCSREADARDLISLISARGHESCNCATSCSRVAMDCPHTRRQASLPQTIVMWVNTKAAATMPHQGKVEYGREPARFHGFAVRTAMIKRLRLHGATSLDQGQAAVLRASALCQVAAARAVTEGRLLCKPVQPLVRGPVGPRPLACWVAACLSSRLC